MPNETVWVHTTEAITITAREVLDGEPRIEYTCGGRVIGSHSAVLGDLERIERTRIFAEPRQIGMLARFGKAGMAGVLFALIPPPGMSAKDLGVDEWSATGQLIDGQITPLFSNLRPIRHLLGVLSVSPELLQDPADPLRSASAVLAVHLHDEDRPSAEEDALGGLLAGL